MHMFLFSQKFEIIASDLSEIAQHAYQTTRFHNRQSKEGDKSYSYMPREYEKALYFNKTCLNIHNEISSDS